MGICKIEARNSFFAINQLYRSASGGIAPRSPPDTLQLLRHAPTTTTRSNYYGTLQLLQHDPTKDAASPPKPPPRNPAKTRFSKDSRRNPPKNAPKSLQNAPTPHQITLEVILDHPQRRKNIFPKIKIFHENQVQKSPANRQNGLIPPTPRGHGVIC